MSLLTAGTWNVRTGRPWSQILPVLRGTLGRLDVDVMVLQECYRAPRLQGMIHGYRAYQAHGFPAERRGRVGEHGAQVILVRDGLRPVRRPIVMEEPWRGPHGTAHDPRIHRTVGLGIGDTWWEVGGFHGPFGKDARDETNQAVRDFLDRRTSAGPRVALGDWNQGRLSVNRRIARPTGSKVDGKGIDLAIYKGCRVVESHNLGKRGSDHDMKIWTFKGVSGP